MNTQHQWLLALLLEFYKEQTNLDILKRMINREYIVKDNKKLSIRMVNWFVTNYSKQYFTAYDVPMSENGEKKRFFVWKNYKSTEDSYSKQMFDPYCRQERILIPYDKQTRIETTIGQLHFFKWAILNNVIEYIVNNFDAIEHDMSNRLNTPKRKTNNTENNGRTRKKREELSFNACRGLKKEILNTEIKLVC